MNLVGTFLVLAIIASSCFAVPVEKTYLEKVMPKDLGHRIVNGEDAAPGQYPWAALLIINGGVLCGSALISDQWVLTAGHCAYGDLSSFDVSLGSVLMNGDDGNRVTVNTHEAYVHEDYNPDVTGLQNDVALLKIPQVQLNDFIRPIQLAEDQLGGGVTLMAMGWGGVSQGGPISNTLRHVELVSLTNEECSRTYQIGDGMLCTKSPQSDPIQSTCGGDSGSALVRDADSNPVHVGVTSFISGNGCESNLPQGFTRTSYYRNWIRDRTGV